MKCNYCNEVCRKKGFYKTTQRHQCISCKRYQQDCYVRLRISECQKQQIIKLNNEGVSISGIGRLTGMAKSSVMRKIKQIALKITRPAIKETGQEYEIDEMQTYAGSKNHIVYIIYAMNKNTRQIVHCITGRRTKENLDKVVQAVKSLSPKKIYTDGLNIYTALIAKDIHFNKQHKINHIERHNLTLRTHLKRLNRKTICYSKSMDMLTYCVQLYLFALT
jgi:insertion element IS1 protein InsB